MPLRISFDNSYARLPDRFFHRQTAQPVAAPRLLALNEPLARTLGLSPQDLRSPEGLAMLSGNAAPDGAQPLAQAYAGHQFGNWVPQLGDGRALLLGEVVDARGIRRDIQLKGSGRTPFSRQGDGRAWLGPVLREYLVSEAMHAMGLATTRALAAVATGETVLRERPLPGAILTRVASSHIRVGTFQYFAARRDEDALRLLCDHTIARHYPQATGALDLLRGVIAAQARLVASWMGVGFIHGVMNTDNCAISGETLDYGPCAFMDDYAAARVFSSIDQFGRYAYANQPQMAVWNLAQLASALLPLIDPDGDKAVEIATEAVHAFPALYQTQWLAIFCAKLGLRGSDPGDTALVTDLLAAMERGGADFTNTFASLPDDPAAAFARPEALGDWPDRYAARLAQQGGADRAAQAQANPLVIPRNHQLEAVIAAAETGDLTPFTDLLAIVTAPFTPPPDRYRAPPRPEEKIAATFCGT
ncbi:MAG: protein adenylyltransferase SelO [Qingshengfaniella sp.]